MNLETYDENSMGRKIYDSRNFNELGNDETQTCGDYIYDSRNFNELGNPCFWGKFLVMLFVINGLQLKLSLFFQNCQMRILVKSRFYKN